MQYLQYYDSPLGKIVLTCDEEGLTGLWFENEWERSRRDGDYEEVPHPHHASAMRWLDDYFARKDPGFLPPLHLTGTPFQNDVWEELLKIPYGQTTSYGSVAKAVAQKENLPSMSAQAVGGAVGRNKIVIIVPCHRVIGADGNLTGYRGGLEKKIALLALEGADLVRMTLPRKKTAPRAAAGQITAEEEKASDVPEGAGRESFNLFEMAAEERPLREYSTREDAPEEDDEMKKKEVFEQLKTWSETLPFTRTVQMRAEEEGNPPAYTVHMTMREVKFSWKIARVKKFLWNEKWNYTENNDETGEVLRTEEFGSCEEAAARLKEQVNKFVRGDDE